MTGQSKEEQNLLKLIRLARITTDEQSAHLADLETARASAEASLDWLAQAVKAEENTADRNNSENLLDLARYLEGAAAKRASLQATMGRLSQEIDRAHATQAETFAEIKKLEHLLEASRRLSKKREAKNELAVMDAAGRHRAKG